MTREKIEDVLIKMGIPVSIKGFEYIVDAVMLLEEQGSTISITKVLYPEIAKRRNSSSSKIERAIRHALSVARSRRGDYATSKHYIGFANMSNSNSIKQLHMMLKREEEYENQN